MGEEQLKQIAGEHHIKPETLKLLYRLHSMRDFSVENAMDVIAELEKNEEN